VHGPPKDLWPPNAEQGRRRVPLLTWVVSFVVGVLSVLPPVLIGAIVYWVFIRRRDPARAKAFAFAAGVGLLAGVVAGVAR
jgi:zinc transporter ZupT